MTGLKEERKKAMIFKIKQTRPDGNVKILEMPFDSKKECKKWIKEQNIPGDYSYKLVR